MYLKRKRKKHCASLAEAIDASINFRITLTVFLVELDIFFTISVMKTFCLKKLMIIDNKFIFQNTLQLPYGPQK